MFFALGIHLVSLSCLSLPQDCILFRKANKRVNVVMAFMTALKGYLTALKGY